MLPLEAYCALVVFFVVLFAGVTTSGLTAWHFSNLITRHIEDDEHRDATQEVLSLFFLALGPLASIVVWLHPWAGLNWFIVPVSAVVTSIFYAFVYVLVGLLRRLRLRKTRAPLPVMRAIKAPRSVNGR